MLKYWLFLLTAALLISSAGGALAQYIPYTITYLGDVDPAQPGSCGTSLGETYQWQISGIGNAALGSLVDDPAATNGKAYRINDDSATDQLLWRTNSTNIDSAYGATIVARVKTVSESAAEGNVGIQGSGLTSSFHWGGPTGRVREAIRGNEAIVTGDDNYHILRIAAQGTAVRPTAGFIETFGYSNSNLVGNGSWSAPSAGTAAGSEISVVDGAAQVTGGRNTSASMFVFVDPDEDGKITVVAKTKAGIIGSDGWVSSLYAIDGAGNTMGGWQSNCMNQTKGRVGGIATPVPVDLKADGSWNDLKMVIDLQTKSAEYFVNGASIGTLTYTVANLAAPGVNRLAEVRLDSFNDSRTTSQTVLFDDIELIGSPVSGRTINLYLDENPAPVVTITDASNVGGTDAFTMGAAGLAGMQDVYFDYVVGTAAGAFAPGEERAVLGYDLPLGSTAVTTVGGARMAAPNDVVTLRDALVTAVFYTSNENLETVPCGFAVEEIQDTVDGYTRVGPHGIRVVWPEPGPYTGATVNIVGFVQTENGEPVLYAREVTESGYRDPLLRPLAMNMRGAGGEYLRSSCAEPFEYADGSLSGKGGWVGPATSRIAVSGGALNIRGGWQSPETMTRNLALSAPTSDVELKLRAKQGVGEDNCWDVYVKDVSGAEIIHWYGSGTTVNAKVGDTYVAKRNLSGGWDELKTVVSESATTCYFNGVQMGTVPTSGRHAAARVDVSRNGRGTTADYVLLDDLSITAQSSAVGLPTLGILTTIYGTVSGSIISWDWNDCFYVDDGSNLYDGNIEGYTGVRCRAASCPDTAHTGSSPWPGDSVAVTGVMGLAEVNGKIVRYFWTWDYFIY